jgi:hypothetical protein
VAKSIFSLKMNMCKFTTSVVFDFATSIQIEQEPYGRALRAFPNPQKALQVKKYLCSDKLIKGQKKLLFDELKEGAHCRFKLRKADLI